MSVARTKSLGTKVTEAEFAQLKARAGARTISEWAREVLLRAGQPDPVHRAVLAELVALRMILLNLHFSIANGQMLTAEQMQAVIDRADRDKWSKAHEHLAAAAARALA